MSSSSTTPGDSCVGVGRFLALLHDRLDDALVPVFRLGLEAHEEQPIAVGDLVEVMPTGVTQSPSSLRRGWTVGVVVRVEDEGVRVRLASGKVEALSWSGQRWAWRRVPS